MSIRVLAVCGDPGGGNAIAPVLTRLAAARDARLRVFAYAESMAVLGRHGVDFIVLPNGTSIETARNELRSFGADLVLMSTSRNALNHERKFIAAAHEAGIPSLAVLDFWSSYTERFSDGEMSPRDLPDMIAVMDEEARAAMVGLGFPVERIVVTGQPAFDGLAGDFACFDRDRRRAIRASWGADDKASVVLFASQPLRDLYGPGKESNRSLGYDEREVLGLLVAVIRALAVVSGRRWIVAVRRHPREKATPLLQQSVSRVTIVPDESANQYHAALAADLVVGMSSILLLEAAYLGCRVLSLQPSAREPAFSGAAVGQWVPVLTDPGSLDDDLRQWLSDCEAGTPAGQTVRPVADATSRVVECMYSMIGRRVGNLHE